MVSEASEVKPADLALLEPDEYSIGDIGRTVGDIDRDCGAPDSRSISL